MASLRFSRNELSIAIAIPRTIDSAGNGLPDYFQSDDNASFVNVAAGRIFTLNDHQGLDTNGDIDSYNSIEGYVGSQNSDMLIGGDDDDHLTGAGGGDSLYGGNGNDELRGEDGLLLQLHRGEVEAGAERGQQHADEGP